MKKIVFVLLAFISIANRSFSQNMTEIQSKAGFKILESKTELSTSDLQKISNYNFDEYRFYNLTKKIQLMNGPLIELKSMNELQKEGLVFSAALIESVKAKSEDFKHETILLLDLGLGIYPAYEPK